MEKAYLIASVDKKPITEKTQVNLLRVNILDLDKSPLVPGQTFVLMYDKRYILNPEEVDVPGITMYIKKVDYHDTGKIVVTDGGDRKFIFEEI